MTIVQFKRKEAFRYEFPNPLNATFKVLINGRVESLEQPVYNCKIYDISPRGMKIFSDEKLGEHKNKMLQLELYFILDEVMITAIGNIVWEKPYANGTIYGLVFLNQPKLEQLIVSELKMRRKKEVLTSYHKL